MTLSHWKTLQCWLGAHQVRCDVDRKACGQMLICERPGCDGQHIEAPKREKPVAKLPLVIAGLIAAACVVVLILSNLPVSQ